MEPVRIQKFLAHQGLGARRQIEDWITEGLVTVNGQTAYLGQKIDPSADELTVNGKKIKPQAQRLVTLIMNKPKGFVCSHEPQGEQRTVFELVPAQYKSLRLLCAGRLDQDSEGMLILTNDGALVYRLTHPSSRITKRYWVRLSRPFEERHIVRITKGVHDEGEWLKCDKIIKNSPDRDWGTEVEVHLSQGKKREIRRLFKALGYTVERLRRFQIGRLRLKGVALAECRALKPMERDWLVAQNEAATSRGPQASKAKPHWLQKGPSPRPIEGNKPHGSQRDPSSRSEGRDSYTSENEEGFRKGPQTYRGKPHGARRDSDSKPAVYRSWTDKGGSEAPGSRGFKGGRPNPNGPHRGSSFRHEEGNKPRWPQRDSSSRSEGRDSYTSENEEGFRKGPQTYRGKPHGARRDSGWKPAVYRSWTDKGGSEASSSRGFKGGRPNPNGPHRGSSFRHEEGNKPRWSQKDPSSRSTEHNRYRSGDEEGFRKRPQTFRGKPHGTQRDSGWKPSVYRSWTDKGGSEASSSKGSQGFGGKPRGFQRDSDSRPSSYRSGPKKPSGFRPGAPSRRPRA